MVNVDSSYFEDFELGEKAVSPGRTITEADIVNFAGISGDWSELHTNVEVMKGSPFGQRIAHGLLTLSIAYGLALRTRRRPPPEILAFLGMDKVRFESPVFIGDTITVESEVIEARSSKSIPDAGILKFRNTVRNQNNEDTVTWETALIVRRKPKKT